MNPAPMTPTPPEHKPACNCAGEDDGAWGLASHTANCATRQPSEQQFQKGGDESCRTIPDVATSVKSTDGATTGHLVPNVRSNAPVAVQPGDQGQANGEGKESSTLGEKLMAITQDELAIANQQIRDLQSLVDELRGALNAEQAWRDATSPEDEMYLRIRANELRTAALTRAAEVMKGEG